jgi:hypothetical protein
MMTPIERRITLKLGKMSCNEVIQSQLHTGQDIMMKSWMTSKAEGRSP